MPKKSPPKTTKRPVVKKVAPAVTSTSHRRFTSWWHRPKREVSVHEPLPNVWRLTVRVAELLWRHKKLFLSLALIYGVLNLALVRGFTSGTNVSALKTQFDQVFSGHFALLATSLTVFASLVSTSGNTSSSTGGAYQTFLLLIMSLAVIWALRMTVANEHVRVRDSFYKGMYPLIPFLLVFVVIGLQLLPLLAGAGLYSVVVSGGIAVNVFERVISGLGCGLLVALSLYWLSSSTFALYIVTLPNMTPFKALHSARELVRGRRLSVLRKLLFLPLALALVAVIIMVPLILLLAPLAQWLFFLLTMCSLVVVHAYMYTVYRELLA